MQITEARGPRPTSLCFFVLEGNPLGLFDSWDDFFSGLKDLGEQEAQSRIQAKFKGDHIQAQNNAGLEMGRLLDRFHQSRSSDYPAIESEIQNVADHFSAYAHSFNTARANRGATEIQRLATQIISDLEAERMGYRSPGGGTPLLAGLPSWALPAGILAGLWLLFGKKR